MTLAAGRALMARPNPAGWHAKHRPLHVNRARAAAGD